MSEIRDQVLERFLRYVQIDTRGSLPQLAGAASTGRDAGR